MVGAFLLRVKNAFGSERSFEREPSRGHRCAERAVPMATLSRGAPLQDKSVLVSRALY